MSEKRTPHVELIDPLEKINGYRGPGVPASAMDLYTNALSAAESFPELNMAVWKVLRRSVSWHTQAAQGRRLHIEGKWVQCSILGSNREWWFVSVDATKAAKILAK